MNILHLAMYYMLCDETMLSRRSKMIQCISPFHHDNTPSCKIEKNSFKCFGCGTSGDIVKFATLLYAKIQKIEELNEWRGLQLIAQATIALEENTNAYIVEDIYEEGEKEYAHIYTEEERIAAYSFYDRLYEPDWKNIHGHYLQKKRQFDESILEQMDVRFNLSAYYQLVFPIWQENEFKGYISRRNCDDKTRIKYLNNPGLNKSKIVGCISKELQKGPVFLVEGLLDGWKTKQYHIQNVATTFGWSISKEQKEYISKYATKIICGYDNDEAGWRGFEKCKNLFDWLDVERFYSEHHKDVCEIESETEFYYTLTQERGIQSWV